VKPVDPHGGNAHSGELDVVDAFEQPAREALDSEIRIERRPKRKERETNLRAAQRQ
jgi:hypothetical protein